MRHAMSSMNSRRKYDGQFQIVFQAIRELIGSETVPPKRRIGCGNGYP
jgi:hypothetical protein